MTIVFQCPYCSVSIRVADAAAGKRGSCPNCRKKLLVPEVEIPDSVESHVVEPSVPENRPVSSEAPSEAISNSPTSEPTSDSASSMAQEEPPVTDFLANLSGGDAPPRPVSETSEAGGTGESGGDEPFPPFFAEQPSGQSAAAPVQTPIARKLKRRRRKKKSGLVTPLLFGGILVGFVAWYLWERKPSLEGELVAVALQDVELPGGWVDRADLGLSEAQAAFVLESLEQQPQRIMSQLMGIEIRGAQRGLQVSVFDTSATRFFRVDLLSDPVLRDYVREHGQEFNRPRQAELKAAARQFCQEWQRSQEEDVPLHDLLGYRNRLGLNALVKGMGYHIEAVSGGTPYRCVFEDIGGQLYFLLPKGTRRFQLRGRKLNDGSTPFPGNYTVVVSSDDGSAQSAPSENIDSEQDGSQDDPDDPDSSEENGDGASAE